MLQTIINLTFLPFIIQMKPYKKTQTPSFQSSISKPQNQNSQHVNEYMEYCNLVGDNGGLIMSQKQFSQYKKNFAQKAENRLYSTWYNPEQLACKNVGPSSKCFCDHTYKNHDYLEASNGKVKCKTAGCKCINFSYIPIHGSQDLKCSCKHSYMNHDANKRTCKSCPCKGFVSSWSCTCGYKFGQHKTVHEKQAAKEEKGEVVGMKGGAVVSYSSMLDGAERFEYGIKEEVKKKGLKVTIQEFKIGQDLQEQVSAWELMNRPLNWIK